MLLRKFIVLILLFLFSFFGYGGNVEVLSRSEDLLSMVYWFEEPAAVDKNGYHHIDIADCYTLQDSGKPAVPVRIARILLPENKTCGKISVEASFRQLAGTYRIPTAQQPVKIGDPIPPYVEFSGSFPEKPYEITGIERCRGYNIAVVRLYPMTYDAEARTAAYAGAIKLNIPLVDMPAAKKSAAQISVRPAEKDLKIVSGMVDNPEDISTYIDLTKAFQPLQQTYGYIIITNAALKESFQALASYIQNNRGLSTGIFDVGDIYNLGSPYYQEGRDNQEKIRNFVKYAYNNWNTQYVLLGGDAGTIPVRHFSNPNPGEGPIPSDVYYSNLDGNCDYNGNNLFGEWSDGLNGGPVDMLAEVSLGRAPVSSADEVANFTDKVINYSQTDNYKLKRAVFIGQLLDSIPTWGGTGKDAIIRDCVPDDWDVETFYARDGTYSKNNIIDYINNPGAQIVNIFSHGTPDNCGGLSSADVANRMQNSNYFLIYSQGCQNAWLDSPAKSIGEHFVTSRHAAVAFIGNTRFGWYRPWDVESGPSQVYDKEFFNLLFNQNITTLGSAYHRHKDNLATAGYSRYVYYSLILFGDPSMPVVEPRDEPPPLTEGYAYYVKDDDIWQYDLAEGQRTRITYFGAGSGTIQNPNVTDSGETIIFSRSTGGAYKLFSINIDGSGLEDLTETYGLSVATVNQTYGVLNPDGETLAFTAASTGSPFGETQLWVKELAGRERLLQLTFGNWNCSYPVFVDNNYILFKTTNIEDPLEDYYLITSAGTNLTNISGNNIFSPYFPKLGRPHLDRNKTTLIYAKQNRSPEGYSDWSIYTRLIWGGAETQVLTNLYYSQPPESQPDPMPAFIDGGQLIFRGVFPGTGELNLYHTIFNSDSPYFYQLTNTLNASFPQYFLPLPKPVQFTFIRDNQVYARNYKGEETMLTNTVNFNNDPVFDYSGIYIAYSGNGIWVIKANGTGQVQIEELPTARHPAFSPGSDWLIYVKNNDIYARRRDKTLASQRLTFSETSAKADLSFSPDGTKILYTLVSGGTSQVYCLPVTIFDSHIRVDGAPVSLTEPPFNNYQAGWSYGGEYIIYISTSPGSPAIFTMSPDGTDKQQMALEPAPVNPAFPSFSAYPEAKAAYISNGNIWLADIEKGTAEIMSPAISTTKKFGWAQYAAKRVEVKREFILNQVDTTVDFTYKIYVDTNSLNPAYNIVLTEILPEMPESASNWVLDKAYWNEEEMMPSNGAVTGTLKWIMGINYPLDGEDFAGGVLKLVLKTTGDGPDGSIRSLNGGVFDGEKYYPTSGGAYLTIGSPFIPADTGEDWEIDDFELLIAIDYWAANSRMGGWPEETDDWDFYLLQLIDFWAGGEYEYVPGESRWRVN